MNTSEMSNFTPKHAFGEYVIEGARILAYTFMLWLILGIAVFAIRHAYMTETEIFLHTK